MARPMDFPYPAAEMQRRVDEYFAKCKKEKRQLSVEGLALALDVFPEDIARVQRVLTNPDKVEKHEGFQRDHSKILRKAMLMIIDELQQRKDTMAIFSLKQPIYGGWKDRPEVEVNNDIKVTFKMGGMKKGENPFQ
jgi:hypothetical protein